MLTEDQRLLFREILDANWEVKTKEDELMSAKRTLEQKTNDLKGSMGEEAYNNFINMGREMFAPKR